MSDFPFSQHFPQPTPAISSRSRSMGLKLILISALALLMTIPSFFVDSLVTQRSLEPENAVHQAATAQNIIPGSTIHLVDSYRSVTRSLKYVLLFLGLVFVTYFIFEVRTARRVHPAQYILVGTAQLIFYLLLLSLSEKIGFDFSFLIAGVATIVLLSVNAAWVFVSREQGLRASVTFTTLYVFIYLLLRLQDDALLIGAVASFLAVAAVMYFTRNIDWYSSLSALNPAASSVPAPVSPIPQYQSPLD